MRRAEQRDVGAIDLSDGAGDRRGGSPGRLIRGLAVAAAALVAVWIGVAIGVRLAYADRVLPGTTMGALRLGGDSPRSARGRLATAFARQATVTLTGGGRRLVVGAAQLGYRVDLAASAQRAHRAGREGPLGGMWSTVAALLVQRRVEPVARVDRTLLSAEVADIAADVDRPVNPGELVADPAAPGGIRAVIGRAGRKLDRDDAAADILAALHGRRPGPVVLPVRTLPTATPDEVRSVARSGRAYLRDPVHLTAGRRTVTLTSRQAAGILAIERAAATSTPRLGVDAGEVDRLVAALARALDREPDDARIHAPARPAVVLDTQGDVRWRPRPAHVAITPSAAGRRLRRPDAAAAITAAVRSGRHTAALTFTRSPARVRTRAARAVTSLLGTFTTRYPCCQPRVTNIRLIAKDVDGTVVLPGERFSLNEATGERKRSEGYVPAPFIADGKIVPSVGGGVSQFSTTLYNAAYFAGLRIDAHQPHSFYIDRYPAGREATLNFPDIDLRWTNDTPSPVLIRAAADATSVVVSLYGADDGRRVRAQAGERQPLETGDFQITVTRLLRTADRRLLRQPYTTRYDRPPPPE